MAYFTDDFIKFFQELAENNHKQWFDEHRKRYEKNIKAPFKALVEDMILRIHADDPEVMIPAKDAIFRINRDIRFSRDKRLYKTQMSAVISPAGRKDLGLPGFYFELNANRIMIGGGAHTCDKDRLQAIRGYIVAKPDEFKKALSDKTFRDKFGEIRGEKNKRLPAEFRERAETEPLLFNKQFYFMAELPPKIITDDRLGDVLMEYYFAGKPLMGFLRKAIFYQAHSS